MIFNKYVFGNILSESGDTTEDEKKR